ncbi:MAG TPA: CRISPR system precrRNA processing endoribonuclease RAMP protein Cas6 [Bryobacteraceae bacterium]|nr:CRISPR system precrRNA processing endoribonuclease RAMP protein Cas6 [Bryobacteraceae bacterium]
MSEGDPAGTGLELSFELFALRFEFMAQEPIRFPLGKAGNTLRGALGSLFREIACHSDCPSPAECSFRYECPYARVFEPAWPSGPSGFAQPPRPFVLRAAHLDGQTFGPGDRFSFDLHLFNLHEPALEYFILTFARLAEEGIGPLRGRAQLVSVHELDEFHRPTGKDPVVAQPLRLSLKPSADPVSSIAVHFRTPTEIKTGSRIAVRPEFAMLLSRIRDRVSTLSLMYGNGPLDVNYAALGAAAASVRLVSSDLRHEEATRLSSRTGQEHSIGGFVGTVQYEGELEPFLPWLRAAEWTGVGRQTVWGKGAIEVEVLSR